MKLHVWVSGLIEAPLKSSFMSPCAIAFAYAQRPDNITKKSSLAQPDLMMSLLGERYHISYTLAGLRTNVAVE